MQPLVLAASLLAAALGLLVLGVWLRGLRGLAASVASLEEPRLCGGHPAPVSVIVAARNEAENIPGLLDQLLGVGEPLAEVIVVDDGSTDATPRIVEEYASRDSRVRLIRSPGPPPGWAPKTYALGLGASMARGGVLLFLDADTVPLEPHVLVEAASRTPSGAITAFVPRFACRGLLCRAVEAFMTGVAHGFYGFHRVRSPRDPLAWMYGCCWAVRRETYQRLGGHAAVAPSLVEDRDFAAHAKRSGVEIVPVDARDVVWVWSYEDLRGYAMLIARLAADKAASTTPARWAAFTAAVAVALLGPPVLAALAPLAPLALAPWVAAAAAQLLLYAAGAAVNRDTPLLAPMGHLGSIASIWGLAAARKGFTWRGRLYRPGGAGASSPGTPSHGTGSPPPRTSP